jgi:hypothetical protein
MNTEADWRMKKRAEIGKGRHLEEGFAKKGDLVGCT